MTVPQLVTENVCLPAAIALAHPLRFRPLKPAGQRAFSNLENNQLAVPFTCLIDAVNLGH